MDITSVVIGMVILGVSLIAVHAVFPRKFGLAQLENLGIELTPAVVSGAIAGASVYVPVTVQDDLVKNIADNSADIKRLRSVLSRAEARDQVLAHLRTVVPASTHK